MKYRLNIVFVMKGEDIVNVEYCMSELVDKVLE